MWLPTANVPEQTIHYFSLPGESINLYHHVQKSNKCNLNIKLSLYSLAGTERVDGVGRGEGEGGGVSSLALYIAVI